MGQAHDLGVNTNNPGYQQFLKESDFKYPANIFVFLDEHPDSINDGYFLNKPDDWRWYDLPAAYHNGGGSFSFADGHAEHWKWDVPKVVTVPRGSVQPLAHGEARDYNRVESGIKQTMDF